MPIAWVDVPDPKNPPAGAPKLEAANLNKLAVIADIGVAGTPTGDAGRAAFVAQLGNSNGTDDTATINAVLAGGGKIVRGAPGQTYLLTAPLVIPSRTVLDMTGCTVLLKSAANCNMLQNAAVGTVRRVLDAVTTAASTTVTSATAAFVSGDVGKAITIQQAAANGDALTTTIASVTNGTTAVLATAATTSTTGQYAAIGARDSDITVRGGYWNRQDNNSNPVNSPDSHSLRFRHVDKLTVENLEHTATGGKYAINPGDCTDVRVAAVTFRATSSDGVHLNGPCHRVEIRDIIGDVMGDDIVSLTARDTFAVITDCAGDITNVTVDNVMYRTVQSAGLTSSALKVVAGQNTTKTTTYKVARLFARNLVGPAWTQPVVVIGDVSGDFGGNGGTFSDITIDGVRSLGGSGNVQPTVNLSIGTFDGITLRDVRPATDDLYAVACGSSATIDRLLIDGLRWDPTGANAYGLMVFGNVNRAIVRNAQANLGTTGGNRFVVVQTGGTLSRLVLDGPQIAATNGGEVVFNNGTLTSVHIVGGHFAGVPYPLGTYKDGTVLSAHSVHATGMTGWLQVLSGTNVLTVAGVSGLFGDKAGYTAGAGATVRVLPRGASGVDPDPDLLTAGEETIDRRHITDYNTMPSGNMILTYFTARKSETITQVRTHVANTAAAGTTLARIGVYAIDGGGNHNLVASTANDTTLWNGSFAGFTKALSAPLAKVAGQRYAIGMLFVGTTGPALRSVLPANGSEDAAAPRINGNLSGQADLPATFGAPTSSNGISVYAVLVP